MAWRLRTCREFQKVCRKRTLRIPSRRLFPSCPSSGRKLRWKSHRISHKRSVTLCKGTQKRIYLLGTKRRPFLPFLRHLFTIVVLPGNPSIIFKTVISCLIFHHLWNRYIVKRYPWITHAGWYNLLQFIEPAIRKLLFVGCVQKNVGDLFSRNEDRFLEDRYLFSIILWKFWPQLYSYSERL